MNDPVQAANGLKDYLRGMSRGTISLVELAKEVENEILTKPTD